jgi:hypothetical protein
MGGQGPIDSRDTFKSTPTPKAALGRNPLPLPTPMAWHPGRPGTGRRAGGRQIRISKSDPAAAGRNPGRAGKFKTQTQ